MASEKTSDGGEKQTSFFLLCFFLVLVGAYHRYIYTSIQLVSRYRNMERRRDIWRYPQI